MLLLPSCGTQGQNEEESESTMGEPETKFQLTKEMVMEKPSPLLVGREFVRQYYTLLNQAPDFLHRFYGKSSSYVHGGLDSNGKPADAVYGQTDIHKKVMSLNFKDCRTKIRHVDAHATLNDGVVVQVMGELSNNRQPMRRFMQTFVLAPEVLLRADDTNFTRSDAFFLADPCRGYPVELSYKKGQSP
ncbi:ras GTPase-activating protein-binding protein 1 [Bombina bombina]|uniref:ras GTPase-activating protein-binding protein 1 n=1 Tax=Bombina bombina TaxID=8345 RepID=UPI00235AABA2|nr:ras GTPase-activating protein-binding protein 1 [Bombina bombina]